MPSEKEVTNDIPFAASSSIGAVIFIKPAIINAAANKPCATHKAMLRFFDFDMLISFYSGAKVAPAKNQCINVD
jgi:hypothetical protein